ncbi:hypothetical protein [Gordonia sp. UCD-TK1]|uniref:hypothetical protein n=1 Tax=Gordonia sp. UCD-TK1 TaxID=1857893 RepID=UPI00080EA46D|nr:hypothetical protein [Gordonia sp. UCD-TK1]OCH81006.1 hypothetical protein A9310_19795 [Gordonia sp. UCD-TK1]
MDYPRKVELYGVDKSVWHLHGRGMGREGVVMSGVKGLYHPIRVQRDLRPAFMAGAVPGIPKTDPQVTDLKVFSSAPTGIEWERVENAWWRALSDEEDFTLRVYNRAATAYRECPYRVQTWPEDDMDSEPEEDWPWAIPLIAYRPGWRGPTITSQWPANGVPATGSGTLKFVNPGDLDVWVQVSLTNTGTQKWTVPDGIGGATVALEQFSAGVGNLFINTDPFALQLESHVESQIAASLLGMRFRFPIPANTRKPVTVPISVTGGAGVAKAYITPMWKRPW